MEFKFVLGTDMSKPWFNCCLMNRELDILLEEQIENHPDAIFAFLFKLMKLNYIEQFSDILLAVEATGIYTQHLTRCWLSKGGQLSMIHAPKISEHLAGQLPFEEKDDAIDARRIAEYAIRFADKLKLWRAKEQTLQKLQVLQRQRERFIEAINLLEVPVNESIQFDTADISQALLNGQSASLKALKEDLKNLEKSINELIESDPYLAQLFLLVTSVPGVGPVTAREVLITTDGFTKFLPNQAKAYAKYVGVIPNRRRSGKSVRKKEKIGIRRNKKLKSNLTMGAQSLIKSKSELGQYYRRKIAEGKHHLSVVNAMRNKMILRIFAVVRNQVMYDKNLNICLD